MTKIILTNDFHNSEVTLNVKENIITSSQVKKASRTLCGIAGCTCGDDLGMRGGQTVEIEICQDRDGSIYAKLI